MIAAPSIEPGNDESRLTGPPDGAAEREPAQDRPPDEDVEERQRHEAGDQE